MEKKRKLFVRIVAVVLAMLMVFSVMTIIISSTLSADAASKSALKQLEQQRANLLQKMRDIQAEINSLEYQQSEALAKKQVLDQQIELTQLNIENLEEQIVQYGVLIEEKKQEIERYQEAEDGQWDLYKVRIRAMEENSTLSYYAIIFGARDFADMLTRMDMVESIMEYDNGLYNDLVAARRATEAAKMDLEQTMEDMEGTKTELTAQEELLMEQLDAACAVIDEINMTIEERQAMWDKLDKDTDDLKAKILEMEEAIRKANATVVGTGQFRWPATNSNKVTSTFGGRNTGIAGASTNHKGIDIGGCGYGADIVAADSGTVVTSATDAGYGNYVVISHGNGYSTLYAHMSKRLVKAGQTVQKGDVIGLVGSTGVSSGPHIHFEIWVNGTRVNPLNYFDSSTYRIG